MTFTTGQKPPASLFQGLVSDWATYAPTWTSTGTQPTVGNGTLTGRWKQTGKTTFGVVGLLIGSTTTFGTGSYFFGLPTAAAMPGHPLDEIYVGIWRGWDNSVPAGRQGTCMIFSPLALALHTLADPAATVTSTVPLTWATSDRITAAFTYRAN